MNVTTMVLTAVLVAVLDFSYCNALSCSTNTSLNKKSGVIKASTKYVGLNKCELQYTFSLVKGDRLKFQLTYNPLEWKAIFPGPVLRVFTTWEELSVPVCIAMASKNSSCNTEGCNSTMNFDVPNTMLTLYLEPNVSRNASENIQINYNIEPCQLTTTTANEYSTAITTLNPQNTTTLEQHSLSVDALVGITVGAFVFSVLLIVLVVFCSIKHKSKKIEEKKATDIEVHAYERTLDKTPDGYEQAINSMPVANNTVVPAVTAVKQDLNPPQTQPMYVNFDSGVKVTDSIYVNEVNDDIYEQPIAQAVEQDDDVYTPMRDFN